MDIKGIWTSVWRSERWTESQIVSRSEPEIPRRPGKVSVGPLVSTGHKMLRHTPTWQRIGLPCSHFSCLPSNPARQVRPSRLKAHGTANHTRVALVNVFRRCFLSVITCQGVSNVFLVHGRRQTPIDRIESKLISRRARFKLPNLVTVE